MADALTMLLAQALKPGGAGDVPPEILAQVQGSQGLSDAFSGTRIPNPGGRDVIIAELIDMVGGPGKTDIIARDQLRQQLTGTDVVFSPGNIADESGVAERLMRVQEGGELMTPRMQADLENILKAGGGTTEGLPGRAASRVNSINNRPENMVTRMMEATLGKKSTPIPGAPGKRNIALSILLPLLMAGGLGAGAMADGT